jgi:putative DNA primase/helicase
MTDNNRRRSSDRNGLLPLLLNLHRNHFALLPIHPGSKHPMGGYSANKWFTAAQEIRDFVARNPKANFAMATGSPSGVVVVDIDGEKGKASWRRLCKEHGNLKKKITIKTPRGYHLWFVKPDGVVRNSAGKIAQGIDVRGDGGYVLIPGSIGANGKPYRIVSGDLLDVDKCVAPNWLQNHLKGKLSERASTDKRRAASSCYGRAALSSEVRKVKALREGRRNVELHKSAFRMGQIAADGHIAEDEAESALIQAATSTGLPEKEAVGTVRSGLSSGIKKPRAGSPKPTDTSASAKQCDDVLAEELARFGSQDIDNARRLFERFKKKIAYSSSQGWLIYGSGYWKRDEQAIQVQKAATLTVAKIANEPAYLQSDVEREARRMLVRRAGSRSAIEAMTHLAKQFFLIEDGKLDNDKMLLNVKNGTIDLRKGELLPHRASDFITRMVAIDYDPEATCPRFLEFLDFVTRRDNHFREYLQRLVGYALTGDTSLQEFYVLIGPGGTGKSLLAKVIREITGEYGVQADMNSFLIRQYDNNIPSDIARMRGARVVVASEANFDRQIDEAKIKAMTGGDPLVARFMRQNEFQFLPEFKLFLVANDFPRVRRKDDAFWRRARVLPIDRPVPPQRVDLKLGEKLQAEYPGILAWAVRGCQSWLKSGLPMPDAVLRGTTRWQVFADVIKRFVNNVCELEPQAEIKASVLYDAYKTWCIENKETPMAMGGFKIKLTELDLTQRHTRDCNMWTGIRLKTST